MGTTCTDLQVDLSTMHLAVAASSVFHLEYCLVGNCNAEYPSLMMRYSCLVAQAIDAHAVQGTWMQSTLAHVFSAVSAKMLVSACGVIC